MVVRATNPVQIGLDISEDELDNFIVALANNEETYAKKPIEHRIVETTVFSAGKLRVDREKQRELITLLTSLKRKINARLEL